MDGRLGVIQPYEQSEHGWLRYVSNTRRAKRKGWNTGRMVTALLGPNDVIEDIYVYCSIQSEIQSRLMRFGTNFYIESDLSRAFATMRLAIELSRWLGLHVGRTIYIAKRAMLGLKCFPGLFSQITVPSFSRCRTSPDAVRAFRDEVRSCIEKEGWLGWGIAEAIQRTG
ncbi:unnamed protein product [Amoebophrya sp. A25]|nr:unnamed protein product [Amoebophrya sp. A25]|eukprot:GSA25T00027678001.1